MTRTNHKKRARRMAHQRKWASCPNRGMSDPTDPTDRVKARKAWTTLLLAGLDDSENRRAIEESCPAAFRTEEWGDPNETDDE